MEKNYLACIPEIEKKFIDSCWDIYANQLENFLWVEESGRVFYATRNVKTVFGMNFFEDVNFQTLLGMNFSDFLEKISKAGFIILPLHHANKNLYILTKIKILNSSLNSEGKRYYFISLNSVKIESEDILRYYNKKQPDVIWSTNRNKKIIYFAVRQSNGEWKLNEELTSQKLYNFTSMINPVYQNLFQAAINNCQNDLKEFSFIVEIVNEDINQDSHSYAKISGRNYRNNHDGIEIIGEIFFLDNNDKEFWKEIINDDTVGRIVIDKNNLIKLCNEKALKILGYKNIAMLTGRNYKEVFIDADHTENKFLEKNRNIFRLEDTNQENKIVNFIKSIKTVNNETTASFINALEFPKERLYDEEKFFKIVKYLNKFSLELIEGAKSAPLIEDLLQEFEQITGYYRICIYKKKACTFGTGRYCIVADSSTYVSRGCECVLNDCCNNELIKKFERFLERNQIVFSDSFDLLDENNKNRDDSVSILVPLFNLESDYDTNITNEDTFWGFVSFSRNRYLVKGLSATENEILKIVSLVLSMAIKIKFFAEERERKYKITLDALTSFGDQNSRTIKNILKMNNDINDRIASVKKEK